MSDAERRVGPPDRPSHDHHLFGPGPKRILALNGGGIRGAVTIAFLERIEAEIAARTGRATRLCDWFDLIAGTSTGAIIATALALGYSAADIRTLYERMGPRIFRRRRFGIFGLQSKFDAVVLQAELDAVIGDRRLDSPDLRTGLCIVLKRIDTGSTWLVANNSRSAFWNTPDDRSFIGNRHLRVAKLVRASTAAPHFFDPELISIADDMPGGLFVDGGLTPHNDPSLAALMMAVLPPYGLNWRLGPGNLTIVSVGTGAFRPTLSAAQARRIGPIGLAVKALSAQIADAQLLVLTLMTWLGQSQSSWPVNAELGDLGGVVPSFGHLFRFLHYDLKLDRDWLLHRLGVDLEPRAVAKLLRMDDPANIPLAYELGCRAATCQVRGEDLCAEP